MTEPNLQPLVSVITATYNRSNILRYAIESVRRQTLADWEMWVVGDACSDDTEELVRSFHDHRIHFVNLPLNIGDQSGPNNEGFRRSQGRFIAYLNHDDLWFPDHLEKAVRALHKTGADLVFPLLVALRTDGVFTCYDLNVERRYVPHMSVPASFWVLRRELVEEIGAWRHHTECHATPSQEWLFRARRARKDLRYIPEMTVIALPSGGRPGAYAKREFVENRAIFNRIHGETDFRERVLLTISEHYSIRQSYPPLWDSVVHMFRDFVRSPRRRLAQYWGPKARTSTSPLAFVALALRKRIRWTIGMLGFHPQSVELLLKYGRRGAFIRFLRKFRGLPEEPTGPIAEAMDTNHHSAEGWSGK